MKAKSSLLKSFWLLLTVLLLLIGRGLPLGVFIFLIVLVLAAPLVREIFTPTDLDERQLHISHISSHVAFYVFLALLLLIMLREYIRFGKNPDAQYYALLLIPLLIKFGFSLFENYEVRKVAYWLAYGWFGVWTLFILLSHGFSVMALMEDLPFLLVVLLLILFRKKDVFSGALFILSAIGLTIFFRGWLRFDLYVRLLMYTLVPLPLLVSGLILLAQKKSGELGDEA